MMTAFGYLGLFVAAIVLAILSWIWFACLVEYAIRFWWKTREEYRKRMDDKVSALMDEQVN